MPVSENNKNYQVEKQKPLEISVKKLAEHCNVFECNAWGNGLFLREWVTEAIVNDDLFGFVNDDGGPVMIHEHVARVAWFVVNGWDDPISIEVGVPECTGYLQQWIVTDGNHRLASAIYRGDETILAHVGGSNEFMNDLLDVCYLDEEYSENKSGCSWVETEDDYEYMKYI